MLLLGINVWLPLTFDSHVHHPAAKSWFDGLTGEVCSFCRLTREGFLRLATNHQVFGPHALTLREAWQAYDTFRSEPRIAFADEPPGLETQWRSFTQGRSFSPHVWNDAYLAAFAQAAGYEVVTFDKAFSQYLNVACTVLP
jgi:toxin-antitoxin system PIN domain toxin